MSDVISLADLAGSVVRVGDGRGFVVRTARANYIITAAHVLPQLPPARLFHSLEQEIYPRLIGARDAELTVTAACAFADPVADLAVLAPPDNQELSDEAELYEQFTGLLPPFDIAPPPPRQRVRLPGFAGNPPDHALSGVTFPAHVLSIAGAWIACTARHFGGPLIVEPADLIVGGMSGSPLIGATGAALGVVSTANITACLTNGLPGWLLRELASDT
jgi:Trypsin-like peptidase domain